MSGAGCLPRLRRAGRHGFLRIPSEIPLEELADADRTIDALEGEIFSPCQAPDCTIDPLADAQALVLTRWPHGDRTCPPDGRRAPRTNGPGCSRTSARQCA